MSWKYWDENDQSWRFVNDAEIEGYNATLGGIGVKISRREKRTEKSNLGKFNAEDQLFKSKISSNYVLVLPSLTISTIENRELS